MTLKQQIIQVRKEMLELESLGQVKQATDKAKELVKLLILYEERGDEFEK